MIESSVSALATARSVTRSRRASQIALGIAALLALGYGGACWYLWEEQRGLIFFPSLEIQRSPADAGLSYEEVWIPVGRDPAAVLHGWWLPANDPTAPAILYLHGNDVNLGSNVERIARLNRLGFAVLAIDYRGFGKSGGPFPSEAQMYDDSEAAWIYLVRERRVDSKRVFIYGHSLGGAVAIELGLRHPEAAGLIAESTFTSMPDMAKIAYWMFPTDWLLNQRFDSLAKVPVLKVPVLFIHGTADAEVPYAMSERLFRAAANPKWLTLVAKGGHEDNDQIGASSYDSAVLGFAKAPRRGE